jgi:hypothetical protein
MNDDSGRCMRETSVIELHTKLVSIYFFLKSYNHTYHSVSIIRSYYLSRYRPLRKNQSIPSKPAVRDLL